MESQFNKEQIKDRMVRSAAKTWNIPENQIDKNFDPLVMLMFDAIASELERTGTKINSIKNRLIDRLIESMIPQAMMNVRPASCIIQAMPTESEVVINEHVSFKTTAKIHTIGNPEYKQEIKFTPIGNFKLLKANITNILIGESLLANNGNGLYLPINEIHNNGAKYCNEIHIAIKVDSLLKNLKGLSFFFDLGSHAGAENFYFSIANADFYINNQNVTISNGYYDEKQFELNLEEILSHIEKKHSNKIQKEIAAIYRRHFVHIPSDFPISKIENIPDVWLKNANSKILDTLQADKHVFVTFRLNHYFDQHTLARVQFGLNAFPAINRQSNQIHYPTEQWVNIIPLPSDDCFFDVQSIMGMNGEYSQINEANTTDTIEAGEAILRGTEISNPDSKNIQELIGQLIEALQDQSAYFDRIGNNQIANNLKQVLRITNRLEDSIQVSNKLRKGHHYLLLRPQPNEQTINVKYWVTNPQVAKHIKSNTMFETDFHTDTISTETFSLTGALGGIETPTEAMKRNAFALHLTSSGGKIISEEDIRRTCFQIFEDQFEKVNISRVVKPMPQGKVGTKRYIEINIHLKNQSQINRELCEYMKMRLIYTLKQNAVLSIDYVVNLIDS